MREDEVWEILQISPTTSKKEIRKAYAKLTKKYHPEESPGKFEQLNTAYQCALQGAIKLNEKQKKEIEEDVYRFEEKKDLFKVENSFEEKKDSFKIETSFFYFQDKMDFWQAEYELWFEKLKAIVETYEYKNAFVISPLFVPEHMTCVRESYTEPEELIVELEELFANPMAEKFCVYEKTMEYLLSIVEKKILPRALVLLLYEHYLKRDCEKLCCHLMRLLTFYRRLPECNCRISYVYENADIACIDEKNLEFWEYWFAYGFGCRHMWSDTTLTLTGYMESIYAPSIEWRKKFTHFGEEKLAEYQFFLSDGTKIKVEFHLYYVLYYRNDEMVTGGISFSKLCEEEKMGLSTEQFFFLLGMTDIKEEERYLAKKKICNYLKKLPFYQPTIEKIAECLTNDCEPQLVIESDVRRVLLTMYREDERFCFRIQATWRKFEVCRYTAEGWIPVPLLSGEAKTYKSLSWEERLSYLESKLEQLKQPKPILRRKICISHMSKRDKILQILEALREYGRARRKEKGAKTEYYTPSFGVLWQQENSFQAIDDFFVASGGFMTNAFVILHLGTNEKSRFYRIFNVCMEIFGYNMSYQHPKIESLYTKREKETESRVKERKFLTVGRIGWGEDCAPYPVTLGESGTFYSFDEEKGFLLAKSFEELLEILFDFEDVTEIEIFEGIVTVSKFDQKLEYCYTVSDYDECLHSKQKTLPEIFSKFHW